MNIAGHVTVAMRLAPDAPRVWLGAALPDLGAMGRFRLMGQTADPDVSAGIALHHATDDVFHRHPTFTGAMARLRADLAGDGVGRGPARAVAHVGPELLIDGYLLGDPTVGEAVDAAFAQIEFLGPSLATLVESNEPAWERHLAEVPGWGLPTDYADPLAVANRLHRILSRRPRLQLDSGHVEHVGHRLAAEQADLDAAVPELIGDLERSLQ